MGKRILSDDDLVEIRRLYDERCHGCGRRVWNQEELGEKFKVSKVTIHYVLAKKRSFARR